MNYTSLTLGELLSSDNPAIKRNAIGILKQLHKEKVKEIFEKELKEAKKLPPLKSPKWKKEENKCKICEKQMDIYGRCGCCNKDAWA